MMLPLNRVYQGDCLEIMKYIGDDSIHCCITSPPYYGLRDYGCDGQIGLEQTPEEYIQKMVEVFREVRRVIRKDGTCWMNLGDSYAANRGYQVHNTKGASEHTFSLGSKVPNGLKSKDLIGIPWRVAFALQSDGWYLRQDIIWHKPNPMPESVTDRCTKAHEYVFLLSKSGKYYFDHEAIKEPASCVDPNSSSYRKNGKSDSRKNNQVESGGKPGFGEGMYDPPTTRNKRSVWTVTTKPYKEAHFATFPTTLIEPMVLAGCPDTGTIIDPFFGAGTTGLVAQQNGRNFIGIELNSEYCELAKRRLTI